MWFSILLYYYKKHGIWSSHHEVPKLNFFSETHTQYSYISEAEPGPNSTEHYLLPENGEDDWLSYYQNLLIIHIIKICSIPSRGPIPNFSSHSRSSILAPNNVFSINRLSCFTVKSSPVSRFNCISTGASKFTSLSFIMMKKKEDPSPVLLRKELDYNVRIWIEKQVLE